MFVNKSRVQALFHKKIQTDETRNLYWYVKQLGILLLAGMPMLYKGSLFNSDFVIGLEAYLGRTLIPLSTLECS